MLCKHFHRAQGGQCAVLENAKTRPQKRKMAIFEQGRQKGYKSAHHTSRERERERERERYRMVLFILIFGLYLNCPQI